jgi:hypothetical protein
MIHRACNIDPSIESSTTDDADQKKPAAKKKKGRVLRITPTPTAMLMQ